MTDKVNLSRADALKLVTELLSKTPYEIAVTENGRDSFIDVTKTKNIFCAIYFGGFNCDKVCGQMVIHSAFGYKAQAFTEEIKNLLPVVEIVEAVAEANAIRIAKEKRIESLKKSGDYHANSDYCFGAADEESF